MFKNDNSFNWFNSANETYVELLNYVTDELNENIMKYEKFDNLLKISKDEISTQLTEYKRE